MYVLSFDIGTTNPGILFTKCKENVSIIWSYYKPIITIEKLEKILIAIKKKLEKYNYDVIIEKQFKSSILVKFEFFIYVFFKGSNICVSNVSPASRIYKIKGGRAANKKMSKFLIETYLHVNMKHDLCDCLIMTLIYFYNIDSFKHLIDLLSIKKFFILDKKLNLDIL